MKGDCPKDKIYIPDKDDSECSKFHAVAIVGYTESESDDGTALVKNSWGTSWGCNGFINYALTPKSRILSGVSFPKVVSRRRSETDEFFEPFELIDFAIFYSASMYLSFVSN